jgi:RNA polymerase primary sigma factor
MKTYMIANEVGAGLKKYMTEIGQVPLLSPTEEIALAARIRRGDAEARTLMIRANLRFVVKIAVDYVNLGLPLPDLIEEGNIGLMKAVERFDPAKGAKLSSYAVWWIKQAIKSALHNQGKIIRLPRHSALKLSKMRVVSLQMSESLGHEPTDEEMSEELGIGEAQISDLKLAGARPWSLDAPVTDTAEDVLAELVPDEREQTPFEALRDSDLREKVMDVLSVLTERERKIIFARYGLDGEEPPTLEELGSKLGITRERARQLQNTALAKLRRAFIQEETAMAPALCAAA